MTDDLRIIDVERHVVIPTLEDVLPYVVDDGWRRQMTTSEFVLPPAAPHPGLQFEETELPLDDRAALVASIDPGTEHVVLVAPQALTTNGWMSPAQGAVFTAAVNDYLRDEWVPADPRLRFALSVAPHDPVAAAAEIRRAGAHPAAVAAAMPLMAQNMGDPSYHPIYAALQELGLPLMIHPSGSEGVVVGPAVLSGLGPKTPEEIYTLLPQVAMANIGSLVFEGTFERFPGLKVIFAGFGFSWAVPIVWRADGEWRNLRSEVPWVRRPPSEYLADHVRLVVDGSDTPDEAVWRLAALLPESMLLYGSDRPYVEAPARELLASLAPELRDRIAAGNAEETFGDALARPLTAAI